MNRNNEMSCRPDDSECCGGGCCDTTSGPISSQKKACSITIEQLDFGYIVKVGCQTFAVENISKVITYLDAYLNDPQGIEQQWYANKSLNFKVTI